MFTLDRYGNEGWDLHIDIPLTHRGIFLYRYHSKRDQPEGRHKVPFVNAYFGSWRWK